jgi:hypothetical protein
MCRSKTVREEQRSLADLLSAHHDQVYCIERCCARITCCLVFTIILTAIGVGVCYVAVTTWSHARTIEETCHGQEMQTFRDSLDLYRSILSECDDTRRRDALSGKLMIRTQHASEEKYLQKLVNVCKTEIFDRRGASTDAVNECHKTERRLAELIDIEQRLDAEQAAFALEMQKPMSPHCIAHKDKHRELQGQYEQTEVAAEIKCRALRNEIFSKALKEYWMGKVLWPICAWWPSTDECYHDLQHVVRDYVRWLPLLTILCALQGSMLSLACACRTCNSCKRYNIRQRRDQALVNESAERLFAKRDAMATHAAVDMSPRTTMTHATVNALHHSSREGFFLGSAHSLKDD